uniref:Pericentrin n=1 Tax=Hippocampus comes TaxID=109280 RepID=A0A3Q2YE78_HIPCM
GADLRVRLPLALLPAQLASFRQKRAKSRGAGEAKKAAKRTGPAVAQDDGAAQDSHIVPPPNHNDQTFPPSPQSLQQLKQAVEKRNEIIAKLSSKLQEAQASRDEVQLEVQSLAGKVQALQKQLQQVYSIPVIGNQFPGADLGDITKKQQLHNSQNEDLSMEDTSTEQSGSADLGSRTSAEGFSTDTDTETDATLSELRAKLQEEKDKCLRLCFELEREKENHQHVLSLMEVERKDLQTQLSQVRSHCLEEKEVLDGELLQLRKKLQEEEESQRRWCEAEAAFTRRLQNLEDERLRQQEAVTKLKEEHREELERVNRLLEESTKEVMGLKASKNLQNQDKAGFSFAEITSADKSSGESGPDHDAMNVSLSRNHLMERYFAQSSLFDTDAVIALCLSSYSFELNSDVFCDQPLLSISNCPPKEDSDVHDKPPGLCAAGSSNALWLNDSVFEPVGTSGVSEQLFRGTDLTKELLNQQCGELRQELSMKDHDLNVLREEVCKTTEELEEANLSLSFSPSLYSKANYKELMSELEETKRRYQSTSVLLDEKTMAIGQTAELKSLQVELEKKCSSLQSAEKRRSELEAEIVNLEEAQALANQEKDKYWSKEEELSGQMMKMEQVLREELEHFENLLQAKDAELAEEREKWEDERQEKNKEVQDVREILEELRKEREEEVKALMERQVLAVEEATERLRSCHQQETSPVVRERFLLQVTERQHERTVSELKEKHDEELSWLKTQVSMEVTESLEAAHQVEMEQAKQSRELETLRLSLMHLHSSQLEVSQETALAKVQASLRDQHHLELEHIKEENEIILFSVLFLQVLRSEWASEAERTQSRLQQSLANTQTELAKTQASLAQTSQALTEAKESLCHTRTELQKSKGRLETLELSSQEEKQKREEELKPSCADKTVAACKFCAFHCTLPKDLDRKVKAENLWHQANAALFIVVISELKEQLLARSSRVDDIERIKAEFTEQKREIKEQNEAELESLRRYFEQRLRVSEESYREEIALLQLKLVESALEESVLKTTDRRFEEEKAVLEQCLAQKNEISLAELRNKHRTEMEHERAALADKHSKEMDSLNAKHKEQLDSLCTRHGDQLLDALEAALNSKRKEDLEALEAVFQETSQAQLEAREAELARKHQEETDEIEKRMLSNMDTLEATYLKEVHVRTCRTSDSQENVRMPNCKYEAVREELRKELAQMHLDKFRALAAELSQVHQVNKKPNVVKNCFFFLMKLRLFSYSLNNYRNAVMTIFLISELKGASARELEACRRELEESSSRQRQHFLEEVEILKVQSGELLQDKIHHLKVEAEKEAELEDQRQALKSEQEEKERNYTSKMSQLTAQLQQLDAVVAQLRAEVGCLQGELEGKRAEMETLDTLLQRRERESQEGGNLLKMLTDDLQTAKEERHKLHQANDKLKKVLIEMLRSTVATEELIGKKINTRSNISDEATHQRITCGLYSSIHTPDLELTHQLCESLLVSDMHINPGGEEAAMNACNRLHHTVDTLLDLLNQANAQLEQTHHVHLSLEERFAQGQEDSAQLLKQHNLLLLQIDQEVRLKSQLELEFHKAEGLLEGYVADKAGLEEALLQKEAQEERLVEELEDLRRKELSEEHAALLRQKEHLSAGLGEREKGLLAETERLTQDRLDLQRQAEKDHSFLSQRLRTLERELEEQEMKGQEELLHHKNHIEDLSQQVQALEKQLKHNRQFIEEQAVEREHERDEFQQEIRRLESQLRQMAGGDVKGHRVESLQAIIKDKLEDHASLAAANQLAQRELAERNEEIDKLAVRIRELEQALLSSAECNGAVGQLEQELHRAKLREEELTQDKQALEQQQLSNRLQISALQSKLDETRHCYHNSTWEPTQELRDALDAAQQSLQTKEQEVWCILSLRDLSIKEAELKHLTLQLERLTTAFFSPNQEHLSALSILAEEKEGQRTVEDQKEETLPSALLEEKNHEIDHLTTEIERLQEELGNTNNKDLEAELHDLSSQVEHLRSEIARLRQDRRDEEERLHEVISTLQAELSTLGPNVCEVSDSQDGDSINPSPTPSPEPQGGPSSLKHELSLTHSTSSRPLRSRLKALQSQLETAVAEKEALEHLLLTQEEEYRGHGEEFGRRLKAEREKADELRGLLALKEAELVGIEEERSTFRLQVQQVDALQKERDHLSILVTQLQQKEQDLVREVEGLKTQEQEMKTHSLTLEAQVQRLQAEVAVAEKQARVDTALETVRAELLDEREALRKREGQLQEEIERLKQEAAALTIRVEELTSQLPEQQTSQEDAQKELLTHAEETLAKTDAALRLRETELARLGAEHQALREELTTVKQDLSNSTQRAEKLCEEGQSKDRAVADLENDNRLLKVELERLREDLNAQEETLVHQERELHQTRLRGCQSDMLAHHEGSSYRGKVYRDSISLSSPEVLQHLECSEDFLQEQFPASILGSRLSELSALELDHPRANKSPVAAMEPPLSRTITPDLSTQSSHSPRSLSVSDNFSIVDSVSAAKVCDLEGLDQTAPPSPLGSTSSISVQEWASDGYGSNVSSELGARLRVELDQTERLDAQFVEYLRCRGMNPTANTDSAAGSMSYSDDLLSPELQALLRKVYQEGCRLLTLSQRRASSSFHPSYLLSSNPPMGWQEEKRALQKTVITLRELLCRMAQRHAPVSFESCDYRCLMTMTKTCLWMHLHIYPTRLRLASICDADREHLQAESQTRSELEETQKQLKYAHETQLEQKNKIQALGYKAHFSHENVMRASSEQQRAEMQSLQGLMEQETVACSNLRRELQIEQSRNERQHSAEQREENTRLERLLTQSESRLAEIRSKLADSHRALDEELERCSKQMDDINRRHEVDGARDRKFISDLRLQLEEERRRGEELAALADKLRAEVLESRRRLDEDKTREEALREQKRKVDSALEAHRAELSELKDRMQLLKNKEREWERERQKGSQEQMERERRQESTNNKLRDLELLRQQDRQRMEELQHTLSKLQREQRDMAAQRMSGQSADVAPTPSSGLLEKILSKNAELTHTLTSLSQEKTALKHKVTCLERQLHRAENELAKVPIESENIPISEMAPSKVQRLYERYLRAESFRKALVYQKRYLLLLLGGFKECEQATLCLIATMGARPSPLPPCRRPLGRFRSAVRVVIAISRMKFLTRKWHKAIRRLPGCATVNVHAPGQLFRCTPLTPFGDFVCVRVSDCVSFTLSTQASAAMSQEPEKSLTEYINHLEKVQHRLVGSKPGEH